FCKEAAIWKCLRHPNITTFCGIDTTHFPLCLVSEWMPHGSVKTYLERNPAANRLILLADISAGLAYLHDIGIMHGDLKCPNILINNLRRACLSDFGLTAFDYAGRSDLFVATTVSANSTRWTAPELLDPELFGLDHVRLTRASDVYSFGMVTWEIFTGQFPFRKLRDPVVIRKVCANDRPQRPLEARTFGLCDEVWAMAESCWQRDPSQRPSIASVLEQLWAKLEHPESHGPQEPPEWPLNVE
ncbi:hypothetical protein CERSUDRAFT_50977, partial [Gelatoporia subvermispora B]